MCYQLLPHVLAGRLCREPVALVLPVFFLDCAPLACPPACMRVCVRVNVCSETSVCAMTGKPATDREGEGVGGWKAINGCVYFCSIFWSRLTDLGSLHTETSISKDEESRQPLVPPRPRG